MAGTSVWKGLAESNIAGATVIIPSVAVGNVAQLTCDLLISSLDTKKIASVYSPALIHVLGYDPYDLNSETLSTSCEIYKNDTKNIVVVQLRAPLVFKYAREFLKDMVNRLIEKQVKEIVILTSSFAHEKKHIMTSPYRYIANDKCLHKNQMESMKILEQKKVSNLKIYGGGFASLLFEVVEASPLPCLVLYKFCSEGDNIPDAYDMVSCLNGILNLFSELPKQLIQPVSWKFLFGRPPPQEIY